MKDAFNGGPTVLLPKTFLFLFPFKDVRNKTTIVIKKKTLVEKEDFKAAIYYSRGTQVADNSLKKLQPKWMGLLLLKLVFKQS